ncbi:MAG TPA: TetR/AcrR family transcriptional regulator [Sphingomicrobium sp.]|jgi:AcrR family transcriptional regulator|nr:TetR/AcrR family transcriptional regulator [Sphingomicrobium sp.]
MARQPATRPRKQASQERSRATVAALIEATARILVSEGFDKASTNRIAEVAGVSVGSLYQYFPSKEALVVAVVERHNQDIMHVVGSVLDEVDTLPVDEAVRRLVAVAIEAHRVDSKLHCVLAEQIPHTGALENVETAHRQANDVLRAYLESRRDELRIMDVGLATFICATSIEALAHNAVLHHEGMFSDDAIEALVDETTRMILGYLKQT